MVIISDKNLDQGNSCNQSPVNEIKVMLALCCGHYVMLQLNALCDGSDVLNQLNSNVGFMLPWVLHFRA
jgi:hypothetical protein